MSETVKKIGKLKLIFEGKTKDDLLNYCKQNFTISEEYKKFYNENEIVHYLVDELNYLVVKNRILFEIIDKKEFEDLDGTIISKNEDETYNFTSIFYNGGTSLNECLESEMIKILGLQK